MVAFGILGAIGFPVLQVRRAVRRLRKMFDGPISYQIDAEGVSTTSRFSDGIVRWPLIDRLDQLSHVLLLWVGKVRIIPVVVGQLPPDTRAAPAAFAQSHLSAPPAP